MTTASPFWHQACRTFLHSVARYSLGEKKNTLFGEQQTPNKTLSKAILVVPVTISFILQYARNFSSSLCLYGGLTKK
jgi:hypothetical protein